MDLSQAVIHLFFEKPSYFQAEEAVLIFLNQSLVGEAEVVAVADDNVVQSLDLLKITSAQLPLTNYLSIIDLWE